ncbi:hypothetical protein C7974DRAFT_85673 [Boeremia exigua]|uniref:uncharacterized protein n=1 Tax=Boeremia exigua TaxID=749465 RepID=UPI001E8DD568|nr:uncharacterized protein C7974DRAFT_85673 [Boeremia exigua]KAH6611841.1 hypothetical protein C7974DRAFT_85673 [Boeremia exigua]
MQRTTDLTRRRAEFDKSPDIDLQKLWDKAKEDFERETRMTLDDTFSVSDIPDKIKAVNAMPEPEDDETGTEKSSGISKKAIAKDVFQRAKTIFAKVFKVIWNFSEFFLPAAEQIPIVGAGVSFLAKAIDLLIQTTRNYRDIFLKAAQLFEQVGFFSIRFEMLMEAESAGAELHPKFRQFLHRIMTQAVSCIALYIRLTNEAKGSVDNGSTREMIKRKFKSGTHVTMRFFHIMATGYDGDMGARTAELQKLIEEEGRLSSALILASVLKIHKDVGTINTSVNTISGKLSHVHEMIMEYSTSLGPSRVDQLKTLFCIANEP